MATLQAAEQARVEKKKNTQMSSRRLRRYSAGLELLGRVRARSVFRLLRTAGRLRFRRAVSTRRTLVTLQARMTARLTARGLSRWLEATGGRRLSVAVFSPVPGRGTPDVGTRIAQELAKEGFAVPLRPPAPSLAKHLWPDKWVREMEGGAEPRLYE